MWDKLKGRLLDTWLHPRHLARREIQKFVRLEGPKLCGTLLDVGCGRKPYIHLLPNVKRHIGVDVPSSMHGQAKTDVFALALALPFSDQTFDSIICTEVLEHTQDPALALREMARVSKPRAKLLLTVPFSEPLHEEPYDYCRFTQHWLLYLMKNSGWSIETIQQRGGAWLDLGYRLSVLLYTSAAATPTGPRGYLQARPLLGPPVVLLCALIQLTACALDWVWHSNLSTQGYGVLAVRQG